MTSTTISFDNLTQSILSEVIGVFRDITSKILRMKSRTIKRVILSKNDQGKKF
jgi:hypothetical protein